MKKPPKKTIEQIVEKEMPGYKVVERKGAPARDARGEEESVPPPTPDLESLRKKYLRPRPVRGSDGGRTPPGPDAGGPPPREAPPAGDDDSSDFDDSIVAVEPEDRTRADRLPGGRRAKRVVVSGKSKRIIGRQG